VTTLLLPLILVIATYSLNSEQQRIANRQKLADAYVAFGSTLTDYRKAAATIDTLTKTANNGTISLSELKKAVLDFDAAFNAIGAKLGPFEEAARRHEDNTNGTWNWLLGTGSQTPPGATREISRTWNSCFVAPYYGTSAVPSDKTYWFKINNALSSCSADTCPQTSAVQISAIQSDIWSGTCVCGRPEQQRPLNWLYPVIQSLMEERDISEMARPPGETLVTKPNPDLLAPNNDYCKSHP
jgi:hypothetical protein